MRSKAGGARKGAGRPKLPTKKIKISITIDEKLKAWAATQPESLSQLVDKGLKLLQK